MSRADGSAFHRLVRRNVPTHGFCNFLARWAEAVSAGVATWDPLLAAECFHRGAHDHAFDHARSSRDEVTLLRVESLEDDVGHAVVVAVVEDRIGGDGFEHRQRFGHGPMVATANRCS